MKCRICGHDGDHAVREATEMMYGMKETFSYMQCGQCDCLQIMDIPDDLHRYYQGGYYSYDQAAPAPTGMKARLVRQRNRYALFGGGLAGKLLHQIYPTNEFDMFKPLALKPSSRVMDVGCGGGKLLDFLAATGMHNLLGVDPFIEATMTTGQGVPIVKQQLGEISGTFDLIMFHHSFEHIPAQLETLQHAASLIAPGGHCMIRIPTVSSYAWQHYGVNWVQLDAPRHLFLHSVESLSALASQAGMTVTDVVYDATAFQFWGSEQYAKGIALRDQKSYAMNPAASIFSQADIDQWAERSQTLNQQKQGDQAIFYLRR